jgi:hypothetical protein
VGFIQDQFLVSKMDKEYYVELSVIASFHLVKVLTANEPNEALVVDAIKSSQKVRQMRTLLSIRIFLV